MNQQQKLSIRSEVRIPIRNGYPADFITFDWHSAREQEHFALRFVRRSGADGIPLVRLHSECITGDVFGSLRCDCGPQLDQSIELLHERGGVLLYMRQEGRNIGLAAKMEAYKLQDAGLDTFEANEALALPADGRDYRLGAAMLKAMNIDSIRLLTNNPDKALQLREAGIEVVAVEPTATFVTKFNQKYLMAKVEKGGHLLAISEALLTIE